MALHAHSYECNVFFSAQVIDYAAMTILKNTSIHPDRMGVYKPCTPMMPKLLYIMYTTCTLIPRLRGLELLKCRSGLGLLIGLGPGTTRYIGPAGRPGGVSGYPRAWYRSVS